MALERKARALEFDLNREKGISLTFSLGGESRSSLCVLAHA